MRHVHWISLVGLAACAAGPTGDWQARAVAIDDVEATVNGILEIDRDGESLLRLDAAGDGLSASIRARGTADLEEDVAWLGLVGPLEPVGTTVAVEGPCEASGEQLVCDLLVGDATWYIELERERDGL
jgi:hypothetical protein